MRSVEKVVIVVFVITLAALASLSALTALTSLALVIVSSALFWHLHFDIAIRQSVEQQIRSKFFIFITCDVCLGCFDFTET